MGVFRRLSIALVGVFSISAVALSMAPSAGAIDLLGPACQEGTVRGAAACSADGRDTLTGNNGVIRRATNLVAVVGGVIAVIMLIVGGFMMVTSGGDTGKASTGKKTITYAIVGLIVIFLARTIIVFVVSRV